MSINSILSLLVVLFIIGFVAYFLYQQNRRLIAEHGLKGVHGFLAILCVMLFIKSLGFIFVVKMIPQLYVWKFKELATQVEFFSFESTLSNIALLSLFLNIVIIALMIWVRKPATVKLVHLVVWITGPVASLGVVCSSLNEVIPPQEVQQLSPWLLGGSTVFAILVSLYLKLSKRVQNTYRLNN